MTAIEKKTAKAKLGAVQEPAKVEAPVVEAEADAGEPLTELEAHKVALAQERITSAQLTLQARQKEMEGLILALKAKYEEGGRYQLLQLDPSRGTIVRKPV